MHKEFHMQSKYDIIPALPFDDVFRFEPMKTRFACWREERAARRALAGLSDRMLADIGVSRGRIDGSLRRGR
jgi:uncharacterized protein YjiS (DUF1127 family)